MSDRNRDLPAWSDDAPLILVINDDGIHSPGLIAAISAARQLGQVVVAAPTRQQTARGRSMSGKPDDFFHPVELDMEPGPHDVRAWHIDAAPARIAQHALAILCANRRPDIVLSGINYGENLGTDIGASGTLGAAFQAAAEGVPALAVSRKTGIENHFHHGELDWSGAIRVAERWTGRMLKLVANGLNSSGALPFDVLKVDVPEPCPAGTEERLTRLCRRRYLAFRFEDVHPETPLEAAETYIRVEPDVLDRNDDVYAVAVDGVVSVAPLQLDCSASSLDEVRRVLEI